MKRLLFILPLLGIIACGGNKKVGAEGISPSSFVGYWVNTAPNDSVQVISLHIGERNDSLLVAIYWTRQEPFFMQEAPFTDGAGCISCAWAWRACRPWRNMCAALSARARAAAWILP
ncbi:MAG: hypothetical protein IKA41_02050, partial [Bacteroidaceae bacterium]|nr:hypothetical protein [Bacteroidaceae bacterium]